MDNSAPMLPPQGVMPAGADLNQGGGMPPMNMPPAPIVQQVGAPPMQQKVASSKKNVPAGHVMSLEMIPAPPPRARRKYVKRNEVFVSGMTKPKVVEFMGLTAQERERNRTDLLFLQTKEVLGGNFRMQNNANEVAERLGKWEEKANAQAQGISTWEMRKLKSREALQKLPSSPNSKAMLPLLRQACEFGYQGTPYFKLDPFMLRKLDSKYDLRPEFSPRHKELELNTPDNDTDQLPPVNNTTPEKQQIRAKDVPAIPLQYDINLDDMSYSDIEIVAKSVEILTAQFPESQYLVPLQEQLLSKKFN